MRNVVLFNRNVRNSLLRVAWVLLVLLVAWGVAQEAQRRIIQIDFSGGRQEARDLRYGPLVYTHPDEEGIVATVSNLTIYGARAELRAPEGVLIAQAEGQRDAEFTDGVRVARARLEATGPVLTYSEATGLGVMSGPVSVVIEPRDEDDERAFIDADEVAFDVDTDVSTSRGNVLLRSGSSTVSADEVVFEEERDLARLRAEAGRVQVVRVNDDGEELVITANEIRVLTGDDTLLATGEVELVSGNTRSTGDTVFFDDRASRAEIVGSPAVSVNEVDGVRLSGARLEQRTDLDVTRVLDASVPAAFDTTVFLLTGETAED